MKKLYPVVNAEPGRKLNRLRPEMTIKPRIVVRTTTAPGPECHQRIAFQTRQRRGETMTLQALQCAVDLCGVGRCRAGTGDHQPYDLRFTQQRQFNRPLV